LVRLRVLAFLISCSLAGVIAAKAGRWPSWVRRVRSLTPRFGAPECGPGKPGEAEAHPGGVQAIELVFELELVRRSRGQTALIQVGEDGGEKTGGPPVVSGGKSGAGYRLDSQRVEALAAGGQTGDAIPQTGSARKLQGKQGAPTGANG
jgi:hypothetical protein